MSNNYLNISLFNTKYYTMLIARILIFCLIFSPYLHSQSIRINEISASNTIFFDEDGDTPDWIEIYNYGEQNISFIRLVYF